MVKCCLMSSECHILGTSWDQCRRIWFNIALRPRKPEGSLGRTAQDGHLDSYTAPELYDSCVCAFLSLYAPPNGQPHTVFGGVISACGGWVLLIKELNYHARKLVSGIANLKLPLNGNDHGFFSHAVHWANELKSASTTTCVWALIHMCRCVLNDLTIHFFSIRFRERTQIRSEKKITKKYMYFSSWQSNQMKHGDENILQVRVCFFFRPDYVSGSFLL